MNYQTTLTWIARDCITNDEVFAAAPPLHGMKEVTAEEDQEERRVYLEAQKNVA